MFILGDFGDTIFHLPKKRKKDLNLHSEAERKEAVYQLFIVVLSLLFRCSLYRFFFASFFCYCGRVSDQTEYQACKLEGQLREHNFLLMWPAWLNK